MNSPPLRSCPLFDDLSEVEMKSILEEIKSTEIVCKKGTVVVRQADMIKALYLLVDGMVRTEMITNDGNLLEIELIEAVRPLAPAFIFAKNNRFPVDVVAMTACVFWVVPREKWLELLKKNTILLQNFLQLNANMAVFLSKKLQLISLKNINSKLALYFLENTTITNNCFELRRNRTQLSEYFGVQRPSLARSIGDMIKQGYIEIDKRNVKILNRNALQQMV